MRNLTLKNFLTSTNLQGEVLWQHFSTVVNSQQAYHHEGKSVISYVLYPYPGSWLAAQVVADSATPYADLLAQFLRSTGSQDFLTIPVDHEGNHPLHYALVNRQISKEDYRAIIVVMAESTGRFREGGAPLTERDFMRQFVLSYADGTALYTGWLLSCYQVNSTKTWCQHIKNSNTVDLTTSKFDHIWQWSNHSMLTSSQSATMDDPESDLVEAFLPMRQKKPIVTLAQCPHLYHKCLIWAQKLFGKLHHNNSVDWALAVQMEGDEVALLASNNPQVQPHHQALHAKMKIWHDKDSGCEGITDRIEATEPSDQVSTATNTDTQIGQERYNSGASARLDKSAVFDSTDDEGTVCDPTDGKEFSGVRVGQTISKRKAAKISQLTTRMMLAQEAQKEGSDAEASKKPSPTSVASPFWCSSQAKSKKKQKTREDAGRWDPVACACTSGEDSDSSSSDFLLAQENGRVSYDNASASQYDHGERMWAFNHAYHGGTFTELTRSILPHSVFNTMRVCIEEWELTGDATEITTGKIDSPANTSEYHRGLWRFKKADRAGF